MVNLVRIVLTSFHELAAPHASWGIPDDGNAFVAGDVPVLPPFRDLAAQRL
jgi:hypothetical protein